MHIKLDEDLPPIAAAWLQEQGLEASTVIEQGMGGWKDAELWQAVQEHSQFLIAADKGFADIRVYPPGRHGGVLLLRPSYDGIRPLLELLRAVLSEVNLSELECVVAVATPQGLRIRRV